jgi:hypothetical protein
VRNGLKKSDDFLVDHFEGVEVELPDEFLLQIVDHQLLELYKYGICKRPIDINHGLLDLVEFLSCGLVTEQDQSDYLGFFDQPLHDIAVFVDNLLRIVALDSQ